jgi:hypothetical protein
VTSAGQVTVTVPAISGWTSQWNWYSPGFKAGMS